ncbi:MAG: hypothetical protein ACWGPN_16585, partial [Gammaproteobacteria bacterium]
RRPALKYLIEYSPERALDDQLGQLDRRSFPPKVVAYLETQVDATGDYQGPAYLHIFDAQTESFTDVLQPGLLTVGARTYPEPTLYGRRIGQASKFGLPVNGIAIDDALAWWEEPFRRLDPAELEDIQLPPDADAIFSGGRILLIESDKDFNEIQYYLRGREEIPGPFLAEGVIDDILLRAWTTGIKRILWVPVDFEEVPGSRFEESPTTDAIMDRADTWIRQSSRERSVLSFTYFPGVLRLPEGSLDRIKAQLPGWPSNVIAETEAALADYDRMNGDTGAWLSESFDRVAIVVSDALTFGDGSVARGAFSTYNRNMVFYGLNDDFTLNHELGHTYLFGHSFYNVSSTSDPLGPGDPYPMPWDYMGLTEGNSPRQRPSSSAKTLAYWMERTASCTTDTDPLPEVCDARLGGTFRLVAHDNGPDGRLRALKIPTDDRIYWVSMRRLWPEKIWLRNGVQIHFTELERNRPGPDGLDGPTYVGLRNTDPFPADSSPFQPGEVFEDTARGLRIRIDMTGSEAGVPYADVTVERF